MTGDGADAATRFALAFAPVRDPVPGPDPGPGPESGPDPGPGIRRRTDAGGAPGGRAAAADGRR